MNDSGVLNNRLNLRQFFSTLSLLVLAVMVCIAQPLRADDDMIDDVETDMDAALAESDAAESEAIDAKKREADEQEKLERAKENASNAKAQAKAKEISAKSEINELDARISEAQKERAKHERQKLDAENKIKAADKRIADKKMALEKVRAERNAGRDEKDAQLLLLSQKVNELHGVEKQIAADKNETQEILRDITKIKAKIQKMEQELKKSREKALKVAAYKKKMSERRDTLKRSISSIPKNVSFKPAKNDCVMAAEAKDGAATVAKINKGKKYEIHSDVGDKWVEMQIGKKKGYALRSCF